LKKKDGEEGGEERREEILFKHLSDKAVV